MAVFRKILVATDYSVASGQALETAAALATRFGAELVVLHVVEESAYAYPFPMPPGVRDAAQRRLDEAVAMLRGRMLRASGVLRDGIAADAICRAAAEASADLVVVGSQGRRGLPRMLLGSVAERVVRYSAIPVLTVHPSNHVAILGGGMDVFRNVLAPTDFSEAAERGVDLAVRIALDLDASLTLVHVYELPPGYGYYVFDDVAQEAETAARRQLEEVLARVRPRLPTVDGVVRRGPAWESIVEVASERRAELVVLSTHGRQGFARALVGSVTEKVVRMSAVPVLTVGATGAGTTVETAEHARCTVRGP
jgi:nucleotide-binding universal stress UspA family protein